LHRFRDVPQRLPAARLVEDALETCRERGGGACDEKLPTAGECRDAGGDVDRRPAVVPRPLDGGTVICADSARRCLVAAHCLTCDPYTETDCVTGIRYSEHEGIADGLDMLAADARELRLDGGCELFDELHGLLVSVRFRQRSEAGDVREQEG